MFHTAARSHLTSSTNSFNTNSGIVYWEKTMIRNIYNLSIIYNFLICLANSQVGNSFHVFDLVLSGIAGKKNCS